jgi:hypothetical protein
MSSRRFGVEIELNSFDGRDFEKTPLKWNELPNGIHYIGNLISEFLKESVRISKWKVNASQNNDIWVIKPDASCGIEVCSPVMRGNYGVKRICDIINLLSENSLVSSGDKCAFHLHIEVRDLQELQKASILAHWIKCEPVFLDAVPLSRKVNRYCQCIGQNQFFSHDKIPYPREIICFLSDKYYTVNTYQMMSIGKRETIEFRFMDSSVCLDSNLAGNWIKLLMLFVETTKDLPYPEKYKKGNKHSGLLWLDVLDVMDMLGFLKSDISEELQELRNWFLFRLKENLINNSNGIWSKECRKISIQQVEELMKFFNLEIIT